MHCHHEASRTRRWRECVLDYGTVTSATFKKLRITVEDYDRLSNDFMGKVSVPVCAFLSDGPGVHEYSIPLKGSKKHSIAVTGVIVIHAMVTPL
jgi:hypothetical protein